MSLAEIGTGIVATVKGLDAMGIARERFLALGLTKGTKVEVLRKGPRDNLTVYRIRGVMIALRKEEALLIKV